MSPSEVDASRPQRTTGLVQAACVVVYLALCVGTGLVWEPTHDEGVAWRQAIGQVWLPGPQQAAEISRLYAILDGENERDTQDVIDAMMIRGGMHPPAYYWMIHTVTGWLGTSRIALNLPAYGFGVLALFGIARLTRRLVPLATAPLWSMALLATSPWFVGFSNLAKPYAITICLSLWGANALLAIHDDPKHSLRWRGLFVGVSALGLYSIYHYAFVVAWQGVFALALASTRREPLREVARVAAMGAAIALCFAPWIPRLLTHLDISAADAHYFTGSVPLSEWPSLLLGVFRIWGLGEALRSEPAEALRVAWAVLAIGTAPMLAYAFARGPSRDALREDGDARLFWVCVIALPLAIVVGDAWRETHTLFISKLSFGLFPIALIAIVRGGFAFPLAPLRNAILGAWTLLFLVASVSSIDSRARAITPFEAVAHALRENDSSEHLVVVSSKTQGYVIPLLLTARNLGIQHVRVAYAPAKKLWNTLEAAKADPKTQQVTLVDLAVTYRPQDLWRARTLHALRGRAAEAGWRVATLTPGVGLQSREIPKPRFQRESLRNSGKTLVLCELANVKYYSMEVAGNPDAIKMR